MGPAKRCQKCIVCLNFVRPKKKVTSDDPAKAQMLTAYFLRKLVLSPITSTDFQDYLHKYGNPSEWVPLCHICEELVLKALDYHDKINKMIAEIGKIRKKIHVDYFYETEDEDEEEEDDTDAAAPLFNTLRTKLFSEFNGKEHTESVFSRSLSLHYHESPLLNTFEEENQELIMNTEIPSGASESVGVWVKNEVDHDVNDYDDDDRDDFLDSMQDTDFDETVDPATAQPDLSDSSSHASSTDNGRKRRWKAKRKRDDHDSDSSFNFGTRKGTRKSRKRPSRKSLLPPDFPKDATKCPECGKEYSYHSTMARHFRERHLQVKRHRCTLCDEAFARKEYLDVHIQSKHPEEVTSLVISKESVEPLKCPYPNCDQEFVVRKAYLVHLRVHAGKILVQCGTCGKQMKARYLKEHIKNIHGDGSEGANDDEGNVAHAPVKPLVQCETCGKQVRAEYLKAHIRRKHGDGNDPGPSDDEGNVEHTPVKPSPANSRLNGAICSECGKKFNSRAVMRRHVKEKHENLKKFFCKICGKLYARREYVVRHMWTAHKKRLPPAKKESTNEEAASSNSPTEPVMPSQGVLGEDDQVQVGGTGTSDTTNMQG